MKTGEHFTADTWPHAAMLEQGWVVLDDGTAVDVAQIGQRGQRKPFEVRHPTVMVGMEVYMGPPMFRDRPWVVDVLNGRTMVQKRLAGGFATEDDARTIADRILAASNAWDRNE